MKAFFPIRIGSLVGDREWAMGKVCGVIRKEGLLAFVLDEVYRRIRKDIVAVALVFLRDVVVLQDGIKVLVAGRAR